MRELRYRLMQEGRVIEVGQGQTLNMGSGGVAFTADRELPAGGFIELSISWPVQLDTGAYMRLVVFGRLLRTEYGVSVCRIDKYEFRTQARPAATTSAGTHTADTMPRRWGNTVPTRDPLKGPLLPLRFAGLRG